MMHSGQVQIGNTYGHVTVIGESPKRSRGERYWLCRCVCGEEWEVVSRSLTRGCTKSCGCRGSFIRNIKPEMRFGYLITTSLAAPGERGATRWNCRCDCGTELAVKATSLITGNTQSCGCKRRRNRKQNKRWRGCGDISARIWWTLVYQGKRRGIEVDVTIQFGWDLFLKQNGRCALSGVPLVFGSTIRDHQRGGTTASLDRIDSDKGYTEDNVQWTHKDVNRMKWEFTEEYFIGMCKKIVETRGQDAS